MRDGNGQALVKSESQIPVMQDALNGYTQKLFGSFREIFSSERQRNRVVFWIEENRGQIILRCVKKLDRQRKNEDQLVGITKGNLDIVRVMIGNFASGCNMTTVCWELYADFELSKLIDTGRFDHFDLLPNFSNMEDLARHGVVISGNWDFDNVILMHKCPSCGGAFNRSSVIYIPGHICEKCGKPAEIVHSNNIVREILNKYRARLSTMTTFSKKADDMDVFPIQDFIDPATNSLAYWWLFTRSIRPINAIADIFGREVLEVAITMYQRSLFKFITMPRERKNFIKHVCDILGWVEDDMSIIMSALVMFGKQLSEVDSEKIPKSFNSNTVGFLKDILPVFLNELIIGQSKKFNTINPSKEVSHE